MEKALKVLFLSPEVTPYAKTGGLADVAGTLPGALRRLGIDVRVALPYYRTVREKEVPTETVLSGLEVPTGGENLTCNVRATRAKDDGIVYFIERDAFFDRDHLYTSGNGDYSDNLERFSFFSRAALLFARALGFECDIIHCHDWQTGPVPAFLKTLYAADPFLSRTGSIFTIHNMGYQGIFPPELLPASGLPAGTFHPAGVEYWGKISLLKAGILYADAVTTVSPTYAREIQTPEYGMGMEGILAQRAADLSGILNGVDYGDWNPTADPHIAAPYGIADLDGKSICKLALIREMGLRDSLISRPLFALVSRLTVQKGYDLLLEVIEALVGLDAGLVVLASGGSAFRAPLDAYREKYPENIAVRIGFDEPLAHRIMAGADIFLAPSRYEPCGLTQIYALRYGTIPLVRATGGLEDTVSGFDPVTGHGTGFKFTDFDAGAFLEQITRAVRVFNNRKAWATVVQNAMQADFSWDEPARKYAALYEKVARRREHSRQ
ncbi:MAG: glycogen synthase GlgA [Deltaproteobacteria bacterium]|nr:glycogen synthase GlgA [Deltaproteobacteria bacterium]